MSDGSCKLSAAILGYRALRQALGFRSFSEEGRPIVLWLSGSRLSAVRGAQDIEGQPLHCLSHNSWELELQRAGFLGALLVASSL